MKIFIPVIGFAPPLAFSFFGCEKDKDLHPASLKNSSFDFNSIMLYRSTACQKNSSVYTLVKLDGDPFGYYFSISETDEYVIQQIYY